MEDTFIKIKKLEFQPGKIEFAYMDEFQSRFFQKSVKRDYFSNHSVEYAALNIVDGFLSRMES
jgi:hypothetical protein